MKIQTSPVRIRLSMVLGSKSLENPLRSLSARHPSFLQNGGIADPDFTGMITFVMFGEVELDVSS